MIRSTRGLYKVLDSFFRHRWLFLISLVTVSGVTMVALYSRSKSFEATATTQVVTDGVEQVVGGNQDYSWVSPSQRNVNHLSDLLQDDQPGGFLDLALQGAHLPSPINLSPEAGDPRVALLKKNLAVSYQSDNLFTIGLKWPDAHDCAAIVSAIQQQYIQEVGQDRAAQAVAAGRFLDTQIADYQARMQKAEQALIAYKQRNAGESPEQQDSDTQQLSALKAQLDNMSITARDADLKLGALRQRISQVPAKTVVSQQTLQSADPMLQQINDLQKQRDVLVSQKHMRLDHPTVTSLDSRIAVLTAQWKSHARKSGGAADVTRTTEQDNPEYQSLQQQISDAEIARKTQQAQMAALQSQIAQYQKLVAQIPSQQKALTDKTRDYDILKSKYNELLQKREDIRIEGDLRRVSASSSLTSIGNVYPMPATTKAKLALMFVGSIILGLIIALLLVLLSEAMDQTLRDEGKAEHHLGVPVLALVPEAAALRLLPAPKTERISRGQAR